MADGSMAGEYSPNDVLRLQRTDRGRTYDKLRDELRAQMRDEKFAQKRDASVREMRNVAPSLVHSNTFMANLSVQYKNDEYIGEELMPVLPVSKRSDSFPTYAKRERLGASDDAMTHSSDANELSASRSSDSYSVLDYGMKDSLPAATVENEDPAFDEMMDLTEALSEQIALNREVRIANVLTTAANYSGNTLALSGADQWDSGAGGNPIKNIQDAIAACWSGRGAGDLVGFCSLDVWNVLARHAAINDLYKGTLPGLNKMDRLAQEFGLSRILVGAARKDGANSGQAASYSRIWGKHFGIVRVAQSPSKRSASFGTIFRMNGDPTTSEWFDPDAGIRGGYYAKVGVSEDARVVAGDTGYLLASVIS